MRSKKPFFQPLLPSVSFPFLEQETIRFWERNRIFEKSIENRPLSKLYTFYDGPPFITGLPHYGHLLGSVAKDLIPRYQTMKGKRVRRVWGWDCHGLPVEERTERKLGLKSHREIEKIGIPQFIAACREYVSETSAEWGWYISRVGRWVDMKNAYRTMDLNFMESAIWAFKKLFDRGLVYEGMKTLLYCSRCGTPVSKFEIAMDDSYAEMQDPAVTVKFPITSAGQFYGVRALAWTTTPWTLPSNRALVVDPEETYVLFKTDHCSQVYLAAEKRLGAFVEGGKKVIVKKVKGEQLLGLSYQPPYDFFPPNKNDLHIYAYKQMVNMEEGTGIVHSAPGFGEIDTEMGNLSGLTIMLAIDDEGKFLPSVKTWRGTYVKKADPLIIEDLRQRDLLFRQEIVTHRYPYCYRCRTPLLYRTVKAWFVDIQSIKEKMITNNQAIHWVPEHFKNGRFLQTVKEAPDWCVSRTRYWATVLPIWRCVKCEKVTVVGSIEEIEEKSIQKTKVTDLHRTGVDAINFRCSCGGIMKRIPEVMDVWFESGSMPYGERHYPFEAKNEFEQAFPADYIVEYVGQIRAWFYYLHTLSTALFETKAFKNVVVTGVMAGTDGRKMSKSFGNYPDPRGVLEEYGGDALRLYLMGSNLMSGEDVAITKGEEFRDQVKTVLIPFWNSVSFWINFANLHHFVPKETSLPQTRDVLNQWIIARTKKFISELDVSLDEYRISSGVRLVRPFIDDLSSWYIRLSRSFFRDGDQEYLQTLYAVLLSVCKAIAPLVPFLSEEVYQQIGRPVELIESVHLCDYPSVEKICPSDQKILDGMTEARRLVSMAHSIRKNKGIKVRQPLATLYFSSQAKLPLSLLELVGREVNVKKVVERKKMKSGTVDLETKLTPQLIEEGKTRDLIREIQQKRKEAGCRLDEIITLETPYWPRAQRLAQQAKKIALIGTVKQGPVLQIKRG